MLAAISPTVLVLAVVYLGSGRPRETLLAYLAGALLMSIVMGIVVLVLLRAGGFPGCAGIATSSSPWC